MNRCLLHILETLFPWIDAVKVQYTKSGMYLGTVVLQYLVNGIEAEDVNLLVEKSNHYLSDQLRGEVMTLAQAFEKRGIEKGRQHAMTLAKQFEQRGVEKGMQQGEAILLTEQLEL